MGILSFRGLMIGLAIVLVFIALWAIGDQVGTMIGKGLTEWNVK